MPYRICKSFDIESGHMLSKHPDKCQFPHGHTRKVEFILEADELDERDMVCDYKVITAAIKDFVMSLDHSMCMNTDDPGYEAFKDAYGDAVIGFDGVDPTTEVMAKTMYDALATRLNAYMDEAPSDYPLSNKVRIQKVRVWETATAWAEYEPRPK